jgi:DNA topoisomerase-1
MRSKEKFCNMIPLGKKINSITKNINKLLNLDGFPKNKLIAIILKIIMKCHFRIGNPIGKNIYNSYGVSTINKTHIIDKKNYIIIDFIGKRGVQNICKIKDKKLIKILIQLKNRTKNNKEQLFFYFDNNNNKFYLTSLDVNNWLKKFGNFTTKDFRTWYANIFFIDEIMKNDSIPEKITHRKKIVREAIKKTAESLHHTVAICKKKYINMDIINLYIEKPDIFSKYIIKNYKNNNLFSPAANSFISYLKKYC